MIFILNMKAKWKNKDLFLKEYLYTITPHLRDTINDHKTFKSLKVHSSNLILKLNMEMKN